MDEEFERYAESDVGFEIVDRLGMSTYFIISRVFARRLGFGGNGDFRIAGEDCSRNNRMISRFVCVDAGARQHPRGLGLFWRLGRRTKERWPSKTAWAVKAAAPPFGTRRRATSPGKRTEEHIEG